MAEATSLDLLAQLCRRSTAHRKTGLGVMPPIHADAFVEAHEQTFVLVFTRERPPTPVFLGPGHMRRPLSVTRLAADADLGGARGEPVLAAVVVLAHSSLVAFCAHDVPVLIKLGPMQHVVVADLFIGIKMEPALAAFAFRPRVPSERQRLHPPVG